MHRKLKDLLQKRTSEAFPLLQVVIGPRQVGKTTAAKALYDEFNGAKIFASADSPTPLSPAWLELHWQQARQHTQPALLIIDEVQKVTGWSEQIKILFDEDRGKRDIRVLLLGSASLSLQSGLKESLAGRFELIRAHHWNLEESNTEFGWGLEAFLKFGGYPAASKFINEKDRWQSFIKDSIIEPVLGRDILATVSISKPALFRQVFEIAMHYPAQEISYQKIVGQLQERGSAETVKHYLEIFEGAFLLKQVFKYSKRPLSTRESSPKIIPLAPALVHAFTDPDRVNIDGEWRGHIFEAIVGAALSQGKGNLFTWRERSKEVDFIYETDTKLYAIEVKSGRRAKRNSLDSFILKYPNAKPVIITPNNCQMLLSNTAPAEALDGLL